MVGVGSGSALNAFNIGQAATTPTAVGQQITAIVAQADKLGISQGAAGASAAGGIATAKYKAGLENAPKDVYAFNEEGKFPLGLGVPGTTEFKSAVPQGFVDRETMPPEGGARRAPVLGPGATPEQRQMYGSQEGGASSVGTGAGQQAALEEALRLLRERLADPNLK